MATNLTDIPQDVLKLIVGGLDAKSLLAASATNKDLYKAVSSLAEHEAAKATEKVKSLRAVLVKQRQGIQTAILNIESLAKRNVPPEGIVFLSTKLKVQIQQYRTAAKNLFAEIEELQLKAVPAARAAIKKKGQPEANKQAAEAAVLEVSKDLRTLQADARAVMGEADNAFEALNVCVATLVKKAKGAQ